MSQCQRSDRPPLQEVAAGPAKLSLSVQIKSQCINRSLTGGLRQRSPWDRGQSECRCVLNAYVQQGALQDTYKRLVNSFL